ncbi:hypothetical protein PTSG_01231 [Salpingoeca rosetta]|uniref:Uncharacterized protein n=1 Tax=Salpingoeca rosetta (strain ATCC 50818 / BSB-021) TaxID=946362 RepID=F2U169_SALR5|nr:uncharacterized protein PTSG_01231 [Salpingoeca rosetta]EGD80643.1 hypothetical protein PTSG_01231 [Salpingoeca rosetta]|eukprot:XP_004997204.1 hypothetical protein PTSG_01231 [Salpingoeca rosetta]
MPRFTMGYWGIRGLGASPRMMLWACGEKDFENIEAFLEHEEVKSFRESAYYRVSPINAPMARVNN